MSTNINPLDPSKHISKFILQNFDCFTEELKNELTNKFFQDRYYNVKLLVNNIEIPNLENKLEQYIEFLRQIYDEEATKRACEIVDKIGIKEMYQIEDILKESRNKIKKLVEEKTGIKIEFED